MESIQSRVYEYLKRRKNGASVLEMATAVNLDCKQVRGGIDRLRDQGIEIDNEPPQSKNFKLRR